MPNSHEETKVTSQANTDNAQNHEEAIQQDESNHESNEKNDTKKNAAGSAFYKQKLEALEKKNNELAKMLEEREIKSLQEKENYKDLWELEKQKREQTEEKMKSLSTSVFNNFKTSAIREAAAKMGILDTAIEDLDLLDNSMVQIETTDHGNINIHGANEFVEELKQKKPHWFKNLNPPKLNNMTPIKTQGLTPQEVIELEEKDPKAYRSYMKSLIKAV